jgi:NAD+ kinase
MPMNDTAIVYKKSTYEFYSHSPDEEVRRFVEGPEKERFLRSHDARNRSLQEVIGAVERSGRKYDLIWRGDLKDVGYYKEIITVGGDGTAIDVAHKITAPITLIAINSDPGSSIGHFCAGYASDLKRILQDLETMPRTTLSRLQMTIDGEKLPTLALNDIAFRHGNGFEMGRYKLKVDGGESLHRSDILLVCSAAGSTAWANKYGARVMPIDSDQLQYLHVGESPVITPRYAKSLTFESHSREGKIAIDPPQIIMDCTLGTKVEISVGSPITIVGDFAAKREKYVQRPSMKA